MNLVIGMLKTAANGKISVDCSVFVADDTNFQKAAYHIDIMEQRGLIKASVTKDDDGTYTSAKIVALTCESKDFLSLFTSDDIWSEVGRAIAENGGDAPYKLVKSLATDLVIKAISQKNKSDRPISKGVLQPLLQPLI